MVINRQCLLPILAAFFFVGLLTLNTAWGAELWVTPAVDPADTEVGDWAVTSTAESEQRTSTAPLACLAILPVSIDIVLL